MYRIEVISLKVAFWGIGIIILGVLGAVLINLFGNIAVTNQLNYTTMKNAVEAAMYDAIDEKYMSGFCLCTDKEKVNGKYSFTSRKDYAEKNDLSLCGKRLTFFPSSTTCESNTVFKNFYSPRARATFFHHWLCNAGELR